MGIDPQLPHEQDDESMMAAWDRLTQRQCADMKQHLRGLADQYDLHNPRIAKLFQDASEDVYWLMVESRANWQKIIAPEAVADGEEPDVIEGTYQVIDVPQDIGEEGDG